MVRSSRALATAAFALLNVAQAEEPVVVLPPVVAPLPPEESAPESTERRDPSGVQTRVAVEPHRAEAKDVAELLATVPGVHVQSAGGFGQQQRLELRGASSNGVLVLLDGIPLNGAGGIVDLSMIPVSLASSLEVLRGGAGTRYGSGGLGGVVNVVTPPATSGAHASIALTYGSFDTWLGQAAVSGSLLGGEGLVLLHANRTTGNFDYAFDPTPELPGTRLTTLQRVNNDAAWAGGLGKWQRAFGGWTVGALVEGSTLERGLAGTVWNPTADARQESQRASMSLRTSREIPLGTLVARGFFTWQHDLFTGGEFLAPLPQTFVQDGVALEAEWLIAERHAVTATAQLGSEALRGASVPSRVVASAMAMDELQLFAGRATVVPSIRLDQTGPFTTLSPKLGATAQLPVGFDIRANAGQASRAPTFLELYVQQGSLAPNPNLQPERALFADLSVRHRTSRSSMTLGGYASLYENLIAYELRPPFLAKPFNFEAAEVHGIEAEASWRPIDALALSGSYTLTLSQDLRDDLRYYGEELPYRPRHAGNVRVDGAWNRFRGHVELLAQSQQFANRTQSIVLPARAFLNAGVSARFGATPRFTFSLEGKNLTGVSAEDLDGYPLPSRGFYVSLEVALDAALPTKQLQQGGTHVL